MHVRALTTTTFRISLRTRLDEEARQRAETISLHQEKVLLASLEDHIIFCLLKMHERPVLLDLAVMLAISKPLDARYALRRAERLGVGRTLREFLSFIHWVMKNGWTDPHVGEIIERYRKVAAHYPEAHQGIEEYVDKTIEAFPPPTPYEVVAESWKQIATQT